MYTVVCAHSPPQILSWKQDLLEVRRSPCPPVLSWGRKKRQCRLPRSITTRGGTAPRERTEVTLYSTEHRVEVALNQASEV